MRAKHRTYLQQRRKVRRLIRNRIRQFVKHKNFDFDLPIKYRGLFAS